MRHLAILPCVLGFALVDPVAAVAEEAAAKALCEQGKRQFSEAKFKAAITTLEQARKATRDAKLLGQIYLYLGLSNGVVGDTDRARECFATALGYDPEVKLDVRQFKEDLVNMLEEVRGERVGTLSVTAERTGVTASIDGGQPQPLPLTIPLVAGSHTLRVTGPDGQVWLSETVTILAKEKKELRAMPPRPELQPSSAPVAPRPSFWKRRRLWTWVVLGGAVALGAVAVGCVAVERDLCNEQPTGKCAPAPTGQDPQARLDEMDSLNRAAWIAGGAGGALLATSVVLLFLEGRPKAAPARRALRVEPLVGQASGLQLVGRF